MSMPSPAVAQADPYGRATPRSAVTSLLGALAENDYNRPAHYFDLPIEKDPRIKRTAALPANRLQTPVDSGGSLEPSPALSDDPLGVIVDGLVYAEERIGLITIDEKTYPVLLARREVNGQQAWRISRETIGVLIYAKAHVTENKKTISTPELRIAGAPLCDWGLLFGLAALSFGGLWAITALILFAARKATGRPTVNGFNRFLNAALPPFSLILAVGLFYGWAETVPVSIVARQPLLGYTGVMAAIAIVWFGLRLVDALADLATARMRRHERRQVVSIVTLIRRTARLLLLALSVVGILDTLGINVTTGIAALGVGGIALALGAHKTVENLVGGALLSPTGQLKWVIL